MKFAVLSLAATVGLALSADTASAQWAGQQPSGFSVINPGGGFQSGGFQSGNFARPNRFTADCGNGMRYSGVQNVFANPTTYQPLWTPSATNLHYGVPYYGFGQQNFGFGQPSFYRGNAYGGYRWRW
jgi:hypothetical protein